MPTIAFVSVAQKYFEGMTVTELEEISYGFWSCSLNYVEGVEAVIPVYRGEALMAFQNRGSYHDHRYSYTKSNGSTAPRIAFSYGGAFPVSHVDVSNLNMRSGILVTDLDIDIPVQRR